MPKPYMELIGLEELKRSLSYAEQDAFPNAAATALNRTAKTMVARNARSVAKAMGLKIRDVKGNTKIKRARPDPALLSAEIEYRGDALNLIRFKARQIKKGVSAAPWGNRRHFRGAFIVNINGTDVVMIRKKNVGNVGTGETEESRRAAAAAAAMGNSRRHNRLPIRAMKGPGIAKTAAEDEHADERAEILRERMPIEFKRALERFVRRFNR